MDTETIIAMISDWAVSFWNSGFFAFIKFLIGVYVIVLFLDIVLLLMVRGLSGDIQKTIKGTDMPLTSRKKMRKIWSKIERRLETDDPSQFKLAVLEADNLADEIMIKIGYAGKNMSERLEELKRQNVDNFDDLTEAHQIRNKIIRDKNFVLIKQDAQKILQSYRKFLEDFEII